MVQESMEDIEYVLQQIVEINMRTKNEEFAT
jgi:hypothetical protein